LRGLEPPAGLLSDETSRRKLGALISRSERCRALSALAVRM